MQKKAVLIASWTPPRVCSVLSIVICSSFVAKLVGRSTLMCKTSKNVRLNEVQRIAYCKVNVQNKRGLLSLKLQSAV